MNNPQTGAAGRGVFPISVLIRNRPPPADKPWLREAWQITGVVVNSRLQSTATEGIKIHSDTEGDHYLWSGPTIRLHKDEVESYYYNLISENPRLYVITHENDQGIPEPFLVSASFDEAHAYLETEHAVEAVSMPPELYRWIEAYVLTHYVPEPRLKRNRHNWKEAGDETR